MENSLKQRIVGAVVLIALAVIFLPAILKEKVQQAPFKSQIPEPPKRLVEHKISKAAMQKNQQVVEKLNQLDAQFAEKKRTEQFSKLSANSSHTEKKIKRVEKSTNNQSVEMNSKITKPVDTKTQIESLGKGFKSAAWVIQVASFSNLNNAKKLVQKLKNAGHKAYRRSKKNKQGKAIYRIYVGPYIEKVKANKQLAEISKMSQSQSIVLVFDPLKH